VAVMLAGALIGATLIRHTQAYYPLAIALAVIVIGALASRILGRPNAEWVHPPGPVPASVSNTPPHPVETGGQR
jgi:hypothetical protein